MFLQPEANQRALSVCAGDSLGGGSPVGGGHPWEEECPLVSREELQGKGPEVGTSWLVLDPERRVLKLNRSRRSQKRAEG